MPVELKVPSVVADVVDTEAVVVTPAEVPKPRLPPPEALLTLRRK